MKILINDSTEDKERIVNIFQHGGYERNHLVFVHSFEECKTFFEQQLEKGQIDLDLIITNDYDTADNPFKASALVFLKDSINTSFSNRNFRISSIPIILHSKVDDKSDIKHIGYNAIVKKSEEHEHPYLIKIVEHQIRKWRENLIIDLDNIGLSLSKYPYFKNEAEKQNYFKLCGHNYERTFHTSTSILSKDFIANPVYLNYDWLKIKHNEIELAISGFRNMYRYHVKYDRKNNERTVIHDYIRKNKIILERDVYSNHLYEKPLSERNSNKSQICDFILQSNLPKYQNTTLFEVKKEDVQLMVKKNKKRPQFSQEMHSHLYQISNYQTYTQSSFNEDTITNKLGYFTNNLSSIN